MGWELQRIDSSKQAALYRRSKNKEGWRRTAWSVSMRLVLISAMREPWENDYMKEKCFDREWRRTGQWYTTIWGYLGYSMSSKIVPSTLALQRLVHSWSPFPGVLRLLAHKPNIAVCRFNTMTQERGWAVKPLEGRWTRLKHIDGKLSTTDSLNSRKTAHRRRGTCDMVVSAVAAKKIMLVFLVVDSVPFHERSALFLPHKNLLC